MDIRKVQDQSTIKHHNCKMVLDLIKEHNSEQVSRAGLAKQTGMSPTSITRIVTLLVQKGFLTEAELFSVGVGRKAARLNIVPDAFLSMGISIDSDYITVSIIDYTDRLVAEESLPLEQRAYQPDDIIQIALSLYEKLEGQNLFDISKVATVGISCIGNIDYTTGNAIFVPQFHWEHVELARIAERAFNLPVYVDNDTKMALIGETRRSKSMRNADVSYLSVGTGVGSAIMYNGRLIRGVNNAAGEIGHTVFEPNGRLCDCGRKGCMQTYLTENAVVEICREKGHEVGSFPDVISAWRAGKEWALTEIDSLTNHIAILINNLSYTYNTHYILMGGLMIMEYPELFDISVSKVEALMHKDLYSEICIRKIQVRNNCALGAAFTAQNYQTETILKEGDAFLGAYWKIRESY